jgi:uncharacterized protein YhbP (UPF0306 family)
MKVISRNIINFLDANKIASIGFVDIENKPYCINCFYLFDEPSLTLVFKSSLGTRHHSLIKENISIAGTILPNAIDFLKIKGIQFTGKLIGVTKINRLGLSAKYIKKFPMSLAINGYVWAVKLEFIKLTDSSLGFGNKTIWNSEI